MSPRAPVRNRVERRQPADQRLARIAAHAAGRGAGYVELARDDRSARRIPPRLPPALAEVRRNTTRCRCAAMTADPTCASSLSGPFSASGLPRRGRFVLRTSARPAVALGLRRGKPEARRHSSKTIEHIGIAEVDLHRPPARTLPVVAPEISIDALERDLERNALLRPARDEVERRAGHAHQMAVVLLTQVGLNLAAEVYWFRSTRFSGPGA